MSKVSPNPTNKKRVALQRGYVQKVHFYSATFVNFISGFLEVGSTKPESTTGFLDVVFNTFCDDLADFHTR